MRTRAIAIAAAALAAALTLGTAAAHDRDDRGGRRGREHDRRAGDRHPSAGDLRRAGPVDPVYAKECGACHAAYPPPMLPATSWRALLSGLESHFGTDAALEPEVAARIEGWLVARAGPDGRGSAAGPPLRITELPWFRDEHGGDEVPPDAASRPSVRSMANCAACHAGAAAWDFDEDRVRIPRS